MGMIKDEGIDKILNKAEEYRKQYQKKVYHKNTINSDFDKHLGDILKKIFQRENRFNYDDKNNVFINYKLSKEDLKNGCTKVIKYKATEKNDKKNSKKIKIKIPPNMSAGQKIIISNCGNYVKESDSYSNLVITIK